LRFATNNALAYAPFPKESKGKKDQKEKKRLKGKNDFFFSFVTFPKTRLTA
jgi:hypothetical protein